MISLESVSTSDPEKKDPEVNQRLKTIVKQMRGEDELIYRGHSFSTYVKFPKN